MYLLLKFNIFRYEMSVWSSDMILALGGRGSRVRFFFGCGWEGWFGPESKTGWAGPVV